MQDTEAKPEATIEPERVVDVNVGEGITEPVDTAAGKNLTTEEFRIRDDELGKKVKALIHF